MSRGALLHAEAPGQEGPSLRLRPGGWVDALVVAKQGGTLGLRLRSAEQDRWGRLSVRAGAGEREQATPVAPGGEWQPFEVELPAGACELELRNDGETPLYVAQVTAHGQTIELEHLIGAAREFVGDTVECFTSFDEHGMYYFLTYIPWLESPRFVLGAPLQQSDTHALSGPYSAFFYEDTLSTSYLQTKALAVPAGTGSVTLAGWIYVERLDVEVELALGFDGAKDNKRVWRFTAGDVGKWVYRSVTLPVPNGASAFLGMMQLAAKGELSNNCFWLDNYLIDFIPALPPAARNVVAADLGGSIGAYDIGSGTKAWGYQTEGGALGAPPTPAGGLLYFATALVSGAKVGCVNARSGVKIWSQALQVGTRAPVHLWGSSLLVMCGDGYLRTYDAATGRPGWAMNVLELPRGTCTITGTVLDGSRLYLTSAKGVYAVDLSGRAVLWKVRTGDNIQAQPAFEAGTLYTGTSGGELVAINCTTGSDRWVFKAGGPVYCEPQVTGGVVMFGSDDGNFYGANAGTGAPLWTLPFPQTQVRSFTFDDGRLYVAPVAVEPKASCWAPAIGVSSWTWTRRWQQSLSGAPQADPSVFGQSVFLPCDDRTLVALDAETGSRQWLATTPAPSLTAATLAISPDQLDVSKRFDQVCWLCTHNAYANVREGWWYAQQGRTILEQLDDGVRALMLDTWDCPVAGSQQVIYQHEGCGFKWLMTPWAEYMRLRDSLAQIAAWLRANPNEIVTLIFEQRANVTLFQQAIQASGAQPLMFYADRENTGPNGKWNVNTQGWPSLAWMIAANLRLVVFSDWGKGVDGLPRLWNYAVENWWGNQGRDGTFDARLDSGPLQNPTPTLFVMNYNTSLSINSRLDEDEPWSTFDLLNDANKIMAFIEACRGLKNGRLPNFLAVDWYEDGLGGGPARAVAFANRRWSERAKAEADADGAAPAPFTDPTTARESLA